MMTSVVAAGNGALSNGRYRGIASEAELVLIRVGARTLRIPEADIEQGLRWLLANHRRAGHAGGQHLAGRRRRGATQRTRWTALAERLVAEGLMVVVAAGNAGRQGILPPASAPRVITVGGADDRNLLHVYPGRSSPVAVQLRPDAGRAPEAGTGRAEHVDRLAHAAGHAPAPRRRAAGLLAGAVG